MPERPPIRTGGAYTETVTAYDSMDRATTTRLTLPGTDPLASEGAGTLEFESHHYNVDGTL